MQGLEQQAVDVCKVVGTTSAWPASLMHAWTVYVQKIAGMLPRYFRTVGHTSVDHARDDGCRTGRNMTVVGPFNKTAPARCGMTYTASLLGQGVDLGNKGDPACMDSRAGENSVTYG